MLVRQAQRGLIAALLCIAVWLALMDRFSLREQFPSKAAQPATDTRRPDVASKESPDKITDWLLVLLNFLLVCSTSLLWRANNRSAAIAERALTELERPFITLEILDLGIPLTGNGTAASPTSKFKYRFVNHGRTPARIIEQVRAWPIIDRVNEIEDEKSNRYTSVLPEPIDPMTQPGETLPFGAVVSRENPYLMSIDANPSIDIARLSLRPFFHGSGNDLYFCGYIRFVDIFEHRYIFGFCAMYDFRDHRFILRGDERYNYTRQEKLRSAEAI
jgi:hypothetical protein